MLSNLTILRDFQKKFNIMKKLILFVLLSFVMSYNLSYSQSDDSMESWNTYKTPGHVHEMLAKATGNWNITTKFWLTPGSDAFTSKGTSSAEMIMGGLFLKTTDKIEGMGNYRNGSAIIGYDNSAKVSQKIYIDDYGSGMLYMTGTWDEATKTVTYKGQMMDHDKDAYVDVSETMTFNGDTMILKAFRPDSKGNQFQYLEFVFTR